MTCNIYKNKTTHHCRVCNVCVDNFDHHCSWLGICIGKNNYHSYIMFLIFFFMKDLIIIISNAVYLIEGYQYIIRKQDETSLYLINSNDDINTRNILFSMSIYFLLQLKIIVLLFSSIVSLVFVLYLLLLHLYLYVNNISTKDYLNIIKIKKRYEDKFKTLDILNSNNSKFNNNVKKSRLASHDTKYSLDYNTNRKLTNASENHYNNKITPDYTNYSVIRFSLLDFYYLNRYYYLKDKNKSNNSLNNYLSFLICKTQQRESKYFTKKLLLEFKEKRRHKLETIHSNSSSHHSYSNDFRKNNEFTFIHEINNNVSLSKDLNNNNNLKENEINEIDKNILDINLHNPNDVEILCNYLNLKHNKYMKKGSYLKDNQDIKENNIENNNRNHYIDYYENNCNYDKFKEGRDYAHFPNEEEKENDDNGNTDNRYKEVQGNKLITQNDNDRYDTTNNVFNLKMNVNSSDRFLELSDDILKPTLDYDTTTKSNINMLGSELTNNNRLNKNIIRNLKYQQSSNTIKAISNKSFKNFNLIDKEEFSNDQLNTNYDKFSSNTNLDNEITKDIYFPVKNRLNENESKESMLNLNQDNNDIKIKKGDYLNKHYITRNKTKGFKWTKTNKDNNNTKDIISKSQINDDIKDNYNIKNDYFKFNAYSNNDVIKKTQRLSSNFKIRFVSPIKSFSSRSITSKDEENKNYSTLKNPDLMMKKNTSSFNYNFNGIIYIDNNIKIKMNEKENIDYANNTDKVDNVENVEFYSINKKTQRSIYLNSSNTLSKIKKKQPSVLTLNEIFNSNSESNKSSEDFHDDPRKRKHIKSQTTIDLDINEDHNIIKK